ncbi:MAG: VOC family protein [Microbacterium sp.]
MSVKRMDNVAVIVADLDAAIEFFAELGLELEGRGHVEGAWVEGVIGVDEARCEIAMMRAPGGGAAVEITRFEHPDVIKPTPSEPQVNTLGLHRMMFAVDDIDDTVARLRARGAQLLRSVVQYQASYRLCYLRAPEGFIIALAEEL